MAHTTPSKVLLATTFEPLVMKLSGILARGVRLVEQFLQDEPTPRKMMTFERDLSGLLRETGRRTLAWVLNRMETKNDDEAPARMEFEGCLYRRRHQHPRSVATLFGPVTLWRRLYEPLKQGVRSMHPLALRLGIEAGVATPAVAERVGFWATEHTQQQMLEMLAKDHGVQWSCTTLRNVLGSLHTGMAPHRHAAQVARLVRWIEKARTSKGRYRPTLAVGRDGIFVPLCHKVWQEGATATVSVLDRRGKRLGTVYLGHMPESGQGTLTAQLSALLDDILRLVDSQRLRLVYVTDAGYHPSDCYHSVLQQMIDPRRPWRHLEWIRIVDFSHACQYIQKLAETTFGAEAEAQRWAQEMRRVLKTKANGVSRVLQSAAALRRQRGLCGSIKAFHQAYGYMKKRTQWMRYQAYRHQQLPLGSGITEAACKIVFTQRLKRSGMSWTIAGGQVILDLRVIRLSRVWDEVHQRYLASKPMPIDQQDMGTGAQQGRMVV